MLQDRSDRGRVIPGRLAKASSHGEETKDAAICCRCAAKEPVRFRLGLEGQTPVLCVCSAQGCVAVEADGETPYNMVGGVTEEMCDNAVFNKETGLWE